MSAVHVEEAGDHGPLLLCLHGIGSSSAAFAPQLAELSAYARVVAWDAPGYAKSPDPEGPLTSTGSRTRRPRSSGSAAGARTSSVSPGAG